MKYSNKSKNTLLKFFQWVVLMFQIFGPQIHKVIWQNVSEDYQKVPCPASRCMAVCNTLQWLFCFCTPHNAASPVKPMQLLSVSVCRHPLPQVIDELPYHPDREWVKGICCHIFCFLECVFINLAVQYLAPPQYYSEYTYQTFAESGIMVSFASVVPHHLICSFQRLWVCQVVRWHELTTSQKQIGPGIQDALLQRWVWPHFLPVLLRTNCSLFSLAPISYYIFDLVIYHFISSLVVTPSIILRLNQAYKVQVQISSIQYQNSPKSLSEYRGPMF